MFDILDSPRVGHSLKSEWSGPCVQVITGDVHQLGRQCEARVLGGTALAAPKHNIRQQNRR